MPRGLFISFEGGEGAGKTTQMRLLAEKLEKTGREVIVTREPGGTDGAEALRKLLVNGDVYDWGPITDLLIIFAARRDHVEKLIGPALSQGAIVICDRFYDSTYAYQGYGTEPDSDPIHGKLSAKDHAISMHNKINTIDQLRQLTIGDLKPDITLLLDIPVEIGLKRSAEQQRYERLPVVFHERLRQGFLTLAKAEPERIKIIDATQNTEAVAETVWNTVQQRLK